MDDIIIFSYNRKSATLLIFFFHALVFSFLLFKKGIDEHRKDSKWLAAFIGLGGLYICPFMLGYAGWYSVDGYREFMYFVPFQQLFLIGPVFYFYIKTLLNKDFKLSRKDTLHFLPAIVYLLYSLIVFIVDQLVLDEFYFYADGRDKDLVFWYQMAGLVSMLYYLFHSLQYYRNYRRISLQELSFADEIAFKWIRNFTIAFGLILVLRVLFFVLNPEWGEFGSKFWYYQCFSVLLMYISITGYSNTVRAAISFKKHKVIEPKPILVAHQEDANNPLSDSLDLKQWEDQITLLFENEEMYKNPNLTLSDVASHLNTNRNIISKAINQAFEMNFNDYVNQKRTEAFIEKLKNGEHRTSTFLAIALDCGFNSKTTFNRAFKKYTDASPKQFIEKNEL